jgi:hypothetical protein
MPIKKPTNPFLLSGASVIKGDLLGSGQHNKVFAGELVEKSGKRHSIAIRAFDVCHLDGRGERIRNQKTWLELKKAGLPVVEFSKADLRRNSPTYLRAFQPNLKETHRKLIRINQGPFPVFFKKLNIHFDWKLIGDLAKDLATMHNAGLGAGYPDIWALYRKKNTYDRVIIDFDHIYNLSKFNPEAKKGSLLGIVSQIHPYLGQKEMNYFVRVLAQHCGDKALGKELQKTYITPPHSYNVLQHEKEKARWQKEVRGKAAKEGWKKRKKSNKHNNN